MRFRGRERFITSAQDDRSSIEQDILWSMTDSEADALHAHLNETVGGVVPIEEGDAVAMDIVLRLKKNRLECQCDFLDMLLESDSVVSAK